LKVVGHVPNPAVYVLLNWSQQLRYGERTARGNDGVNESSWALVLGERRKERNSTRIMGSRDMVRDIAAPSRASATSAPDRKNNKRKELLLAE
jgi:hypothetical protein